MKRLDFKIHGMDCAEEVAILKRELGPLVGGVDRLSFDALNGKMSAFIDPDTLTADAIQQAVARTGMKAELRQSESGTSENASCRSAYGQTLLTALSGLFTLVGFITHVVLTGNLMEALAGEGAHLPLITQGMYLIGMATGVWRVIPKAWHAARRVRPDINMLMTIAVIGALGIGEWFEAATVAFLFALSLTLESWSVGRARKAIAALMDLTPPMARRIYEDGRQEELAPDQVPPGSRILVRPGERIPLDGRVTDGTGAVNQAPITGESMPVFKQPGEAVFAGTINGDGVLEIETTKPATDTTLASIIRMVGEAHSKRAPSEQWVERFAGVYTPAILGLALLILLVPPLIFAASREEWFYRALVLLVIGCPCALVISTPVSVVAALAASARHGVLVKGGVYMEAPAHLKAIAFDKTGTLTEGRVRVVEIAPVNGYTETQLLECAGAIEAQSNHPVGRAIVACARERNMTLPPAEDVQTVQGKGVTARVRGARLWIGSPRFLEDRNRNDEATRRKLDALSQSGHTVMAVGNQDHLIGFITVTDGIRSEAAQALQGLRETGVEHLVMLTGDNEKTARIIAQKAGIDEVHAGLLPEDKVAVVDALVSKYGRVAMVGDGVNDAPAMGRASLGIAMGAVGSDAAIETADIALMSDDLSRLPWLMRHARRTLTIIRQNIAFALGVKVLFVGMTFLGAASLWAAIAADMGASLLVIMNGLRLLRAETMHASPPHRVS